MTRVLQREQLVARPRSEVFAFFADARNLERLTPASLHFQILTPDPIVMRPGTLIDYRIALFGVPFGWRTRIDVFEPESRFVDTQLKGPYSVWRHTHEFVDDARGTRVLDHVEYEVPLGVLGEVARVLFVDAQLRAIFDFRKEAIDRVFRSSSVHREVPSTSSSRSLT
jgi:ligand-binding SRPBCC domain-containing protein